jgi:hypothetical protein
VSENRTLRRIFEPNGDAVAGGWRRLHNEELHDLYASLNIIRVIKSWKIGWTLHVALTENSINAYMKGGYVKDDVTEVKMSMWTEFIWLTIGTSVRLL